MQSCGPPGIEFETNALVCTVSSNASPQEPRKRSDPSAKLYSEKWSLNRQGSDNGKQVY